MKKLAIMVLIVAAAFVFATPMVFAAVGVTVATGGGAISADTNTTNGTATWTTLTGPTISEGVARDITPGSGTIVFNAPSGFSFNTGATVTATITKDAGSGTCFTFSSNSATPTANAITYTLTARDSNASTRCHVTFSNIQVRPTVGTPLAYGNITNVGSNTSVPGGTTNYGTLTEVAGAKNKLVYTVQPSATATTGVDFAAKPIIALQDQYGNMKVSDSASKVILSPVLSNQSCGGTAGSGTLASTPASGAAVSSGTITYTAMQYSFGESIKICASSVGVTSALSNAIAVSNPVPTITSISPTSTIIGATQFTLTVNGANFVQNSVVSWNGAARATSFISANQLTAAISASDVTATGTFSIAATSPAPGGGVSNLQTFTVLQFAPGAVKFIFANAPASATAGDTVTFNVEAVDSFGAIDTSFNQDVTVTKTGSGSGAPAGGGLVTIINGVGTSTINDTVAETVNLAMQDTQSTGLNVSSTASVVFSSGPATQLSLNHPGNMNTGTRLGYTLSRKDQFGNITSVSGTVVYLYSSSTSTGKAFFDAATGGNQISSTTIPVGSTSTKFWYYETIAGTYTITASDNPTAPDGAAGIADATDNLTVAPGAVKFVFANVPASATAGDTVTFNVEAVDSFGAIDTSFNQDVTVTKTGSGSGGGLVNIVNGIATTTVTDAVAENVSLGLQDTQSTGLGVTDVKTIAFIAAPAQPAAPTSVPPPAAATGIPIGIKPGINITFSGLAYPGASISLIRKDLGLLQAPVLQKVSAADDGNFSVKLDNIKRLTGQTYILVFADGNGTISETKAYNIPSGKENFVDDNLVIAPTVGFSGDSIVGKNGSIIIQGYAAPKSTVTILVDGNNVGTITVNNSSGQYRFVLSADNFATGRHSVSAIQVHDKTQSDSSSQQSFTVSPLANPKLDLNGDGTIDIKDLSIYLSYLKNLGAGVNGFNTADKNLLRVLDLNGDGKLDVRDLSIFLRAASLK